MPSENIVTSNAMHNHLKGFKNTPRILGLMKDGHAKLSDWQGLVKVKAFLHSKRLSAIVPLDFAKSLNVVYFPQLGRVLDLYPQ